MLLSKQPGDTGVYATATSHEVRLYYVLDRVLPFVPGRAAAAEAAGVLEGWYASHLDPTSLIDTATVAQRIAAAPACVPREHLRMLYRLTATGTGASRAGGVGRAADVPTPTAYQRQQSGSSGGGGFFTAAAAAASEVPPQPQRQHEEATTAATHRWGQPLIPFHTVPCTSTSTSGVSGSDSARPYSARGYVARSSQEWATPTAPAEESSGGFFSSPFMGSGPSAGLTSGGLHGVVPTAGRTGRSTGSARGVYGGAITPAAVPTSLSLSCATDCFLFLYASSEGHCWIGRSDATTLSPLRVSTALQIRRHGGGMAGAGVGGGGSRHGGGMGGTVASSSPRPPRPYATSFGVPVNTSFPTHSFASSERNATPPNTVVDDSGVPHAAAAALMGSDGDEEDGEDEEEEDDDNVELGDGAVRSGGSGDARRMRRRRRSYSAGAARPPSASVLEGLSGVTATMIALPTGGAFTRQDRVVTASGWDPRNAAILALGRHGGMVQLLDVEYMAGSAASTRCSSTTCSAASDDTAEPFIASVNGAARTTTSGGGGGTVVGPSLSPYGATDHLSYRVLQQREMVGPVTALDWMPQSHLTVVAARRRDGLGCYAELLDLRASHDGITYLGAPPEVFGVPVYSRGGAESAAPSVLCSAEHVACHPSQRYIATVGTARMRDIVQLWDVRMTSRPVASQVYARAGYTSLCWSAMDSGVVLGTTRDGGLRAHTFREVTTRTAGGPPTTSSNAAGFGGGGHGVSHRSRRRRGTSSAAAPLRSHSLGGSGGEQEGAEAWGGGHQGTSHNHAHHTTTNTNNNNNSGYSGTEAEDDLLDDSGSFRSGFSFDGAATALSSTTEGSNALVHVRVKAQSALKCRLPARVPAAAVSWVCRPSAERTTSTTAAAANATTAADRGEGSPRTATPHQRARTSDARQHLSDESDVNDDEENAAAKRDAGVLQPGCRTDLPQLLLMNSKNGELYTQVYNPRGSIVTILNLSMGLIGTGPNAFLVRPNGKYEAAARAHEEMVMLQLERQSAVSNTKMSTLLSHTGTAAAGAGGGGGTGGATAASQSGRGVSSAPPASTSGGVMLAGGGSSVDGDGVASTTSAASAPVRRLADHPVDLMGLGLLDEEDDEEEEDEEISEEDGVARGERRERSRGSGGASADNAGLQEQQHAERRSGGAPHLKSDSGDALADQVNSEVLTVTATGATSGGVGTEPASVPSGVRQANLIAGSLEARRSQSRAVSGGGGGGDGLPGGGQLPELHTTRTHHGTATPLPLHSSSSSRPMSPLAQGGAADAAAAVGTAAAYEEVPAELGYCEFHRVERPRLVWRRLRGGFSCDPLRNLRVLLHEGIDREAYTTFLYGCCTSLLLYPTSALPTARSASPVRPGNHRTTTTTTSSASTAFPLVLGVRRVVPGLLELLVSEQRLRSRLGLRDTRLSARFRLRREHMTSGGACGASTAATTAADTAAGKAALGVASLTTAATTAARSLPTPPTALSGGKSLGLVVPLLPGLPTATHGGHKGPPGFFRSPFEAAAAALRSGARLPTTPASLSFAGSSSPAGGRSAGGVTASATSSIAAASAASSASAAASSGSRGDGSGGQQRAGAGSDEQPIHAAALGMLHRLILQSMGWLSPPSTCHVDGQGRGEAGAAAAAATAATETSLGTSSVAPHRQQQQQHPAEAFFVQGDGIGMRSLQEALERRVTVLVLLDRFEEAAALLSLHSTHNPHYPSIALTLSAARGPSAALLSLAAPDSPGVTFWLHLLLTYLSLLMDKQGFVPEAQRARTITLGPSEEGERGVAAVADTRFDALFALSEQRAVVLRLLRGTPRLAMSDKVALATALLLPPHYHSAHVDNLIEVLRVLVRQQYSCHIAPLRLQGVGGMAMGCTYNSGGAAAAVPLPGSGAGTAATSPYYSPATSPPPPGLTTAQRRLEGKRGNTLAVTSPPPLMPTPQLHPPAQGTSAHVGVPRSHSRGDSHDGYPYTDVPSAGSAAGIGIAGDAFEPISGCSLLLVTAVEGASTDCRALQRYVDESGDTQTTLCYTAVFGNATSATYRQWREAYRQQLNDQGLSMWRSQLDLQCVKLLKAREEVERALLSEGRGGGDGGGAAAAMGFAALDGRGGSSSGGGGGGGGAGGVRASAGGVGGPTGAAGTSAVGSVPGGSAAGALSGGMAAPKGFPGSLGVLGGGDVGAAAPSSSSAAAMMSTQTAMMMKRTLKGFAQTTAATSTTERDRSMREAAAAAAAAASGAAAGFGLTSDPSRSVELRCNCGQAMHATARGKGDISSMVSTNISRKQLIPCGNPECRQWQTPMCTVCGERMEHRATELPPERFFAWCSVCLHGGHWCHLREWFSKHTKCPVENCPCHCCDGAHLT